MQLEADEEEHEDEEEGEADEELGDCCDAVVVAETVVVCVRFCCPFNSRSSVKDAALILLRRLQPPFPFVIVLLVLWLLLQLLDMQLDAGGRPECKSDVLLLFVEALLISRL